MVRTRISKTLMSTTFVIVILLAITGMPIASAQVPTIGEVKITPDNVSLEGDTSETVNITYEDPTEPPQGIAYTLRYDPDVIEVTNQEKGPYLGGGIDNSDISTPGEVEYVEVIFEEGDVDENNNTVSTITIEPVCGLSGGETTDLEFTSVEAADSDVEYTIAATNGTVEIEGSTSPCNADDDNSDNSGSSGGGGGGGAAGADDGGPPTTEEIRSTLSLVEPSTESVSELADTDSDTPGVQHQPEDTDSVRDISFDNEDATGSVEITEYTDPPQQIQTDVSESVSGAGAIEQDFTTVSVADISPDGEAAQESQATVEFSVPADKVDSPEQLTVVKEDYVFELQDDTWVELETTVEETNNEEVIVSAQTDGFSLFAITETEPENTNTNNQTQVEETEETEETDDGIPGFGIPIAILAVIILSILGRYTPQH